MRLALSIGALADPIKKQLKAQGIDLSAKDSKALQSDVDAINRLRIRGLLTDAEGRKACQRFMNLVDFTVCKGAQHD